MLKEYESNNNIKEKVLINERQVESIGTKLIQLLCDLVSLAVLILGALFLSNFDAQDGMVTFMATCLSLVGLVGLVSVVIYYFKGTRTSA